MHYDKCREEVSTPNRGEGIDKAGVYTDNANMYINGHILSFVLALNVTNQRFKDEFETTQFKVPYAFTCNLICDYRSFQYFDLSLRMIDCLYLESSCW